MGEQTAIAWTDHTFNAWIGCARVSPGCENCYAETQANFRKSWGVTWGVHGTRKMMSESYWKQPLLWNAKAAADGVRRRVFCCSLADVFEDRPDLVAPRARLRETIERCERLDFQLLTKRPENVVRLSPYWAEGFPPNVWIGTTVEDQKRAGQRIPELLKIPARVRFLSCEPLLETVDLRWWVNHLWTIVGGWSPGDPEPRPAIGWVIVGGESGNGARTFDLGWARSIVAQCKEAGVPVFVKQMGARPDLSEPRPIDRVLLPLIEEGIIHFRDRRHGKDPSEWPADLRVQQFPPAA